MQISDAVDVDLDNVSSVIGVLRGSGVSFCRVLLYLPFWSVLGICNGTG